MKTLFPFVFFVLSFFTAFAQQKTFNIKDASIGQFRQFLPTNYYNLQWRGNSKYFSFNDYNFLYAQHVNKPDTIVILSVNELNKALKLINADTLNVFPNITWANFDDFYFYSQANWFNYNCVSKKITDAIYLPANAQNKTLNYLTKQIAFTINQNLFVAKNSIVTQITFDTTTNIVSGQSISRNEFGIDNGIFWSPSGRCIAFYQKNETYVAPYPIVDINERQALHKPIKYPMAGQKSEHVCVGIYNTLTDSTIFIEKNDTITEKYITNLTWSPDENYVYLQILNREQNKMQLNSYNTITGIYNKTLLTESNEKYVEPLNPLLFINNNQFIFQSRNNGFNHAFLYNTNGNIIKQITNGNWEITSLIFADEKVLYYMSTQKSPLERHFYCTNIKTLETKTLTSIEGYHNIIYNPGKNIFIDNFSNTKNPNQVNICDNNGNIIRTAIKADNPYKNYSMPNMIIDSLIAADNKTKLYYRLITPPNIDSTAKYPVIYYVYGGPHAQLINNEWLGGARLWDYYMAQKGYIVLTIDNRGSANRGLEFENIIHRTCGVNEMNDQMLGLPILQKLGFADMDRIGVHGWSYGGFMTISLMLNYPNIFKVGVAGGPVIDWKYYEVMYGERYMDSPDENPQGYLTTSLLPKASYLEGKLLIIHGGIDPVVVWQHSQLFIQECIKNQIPVDYFVYPSDEHNVRGLNRIHLLDKITRYFDDYLK